DAIQSITWGGGQFVAGGTNQDLNGDHGPTPMFTSPDGVTWTREILANVPGPTIYGVAWNGARYVAVGDASAISGQPTSIVASNDGVTWIDATPPATINASGLTAVIWNGTEFITVGGFGDAFTSPDGLTWTPARTGSADFFASIASSGSTCVAG